MSLRLLQLIITDFATTAIARSSGRLDKHWSRFGSQSFRKPGELTNRTRLEDKGNNLRIVTHECLCLTHRDTHHLWCKLSGHLSALSVGMNTQLPLCVHPDRFLTSLFDTLEKGVSKKTMPTISVNWSRLHAQGIEPEALVRHQQTWEKAGYKVYFQVQDQKDLTVLQKMTAPEQRKPQSNGYQLAFYFVSGVLASLITIFVGWLGLR
jgi:hypothetical protein